MRVHSFPLVLSCMALLSILPTHGSSQTTRVATLHQPDASRTATVRFQQLAELWRKAYNSGDAKNLLPLYTRDAQYISSHVPGLVAEGIDRVIRNFQRGIDSGGHIDAVEILSTNVGCDLGTLLCRYDATNSGQMVSGRNLLVVKKIKGKWLIALHMTVV